MPTGQLDDARGPGESSPSHEGTSVMVTVASEDEAPSCPEAGPSSSTSQANPRNRLEHYFSNGAGIALLATLTAVLGIVAIGEPAIHRGPVDRNAVHGAGPARIDPGLLTHPAVRASRQQDAGPGSQLAHLEDQSLRVPGINRRAPLPQPSVSIPGPEAVTRTADLPAEVTVPRAPAASSPSTAARTEALTELKTDAAHWIGVATASLERIR